MIKDFRLPVSLRGPFPGGVFYCGDCAIGYRSDEIPTWGKREFVISDDGSIDGQFGIIFAEKPVCLSWG